MASEPKVVSHDAPLKIMAQDLRRMTANKSQAYPWKIQFSADNANSHGVVIEVSQIWLQGSVKSSMNDNENILLTDGTGDVLVTKCARVPGDRSWIKPGAYCGVLASAKRPTKLPPEVEAIKLMHISEKKCEAECMWPLEVQELASFLRGSITFHL